MLKSCNTNNRMNFVVLGAGRPLHGEQHTALRGASSKSLVLDWALKAVEFLQPEVTFVGGYKVDEVVRRYPDLKYVINSDWEATGAAVSLLDASLQVGNEYYVSYADILYRESLVRQMASSDADVVVAVDRAWQQRFEGRTDSDLSRCEKVTCCGEVVTRLGSDIDAPLADAEFIGLIRLNSRAIELLDRDAALLLDRMKHAKLSQLVEYLRTKGVSVQAVDADGDWAELNEQQDLAHFVLGTKAQTLSRLQGVVRCSRIEDQVSFRVSDWKIDADSIIEKITKSFVNTSLVVRSSALSEDGFSSANAGAYTSVLNVSSDSLELIREAINKVIESYEDANPVNQVLVQPMVKDVRASGVAFTRTLVRGAPYYVVNYDDITSSTESITSGSSNDHKTLLVHRGEHSELSHVPEVIRGLFPAMQEIESLLNLESLDIEFAITGKDQVHVLQVRPIAVEHSLETGDGEALEKSLQQAERRFELLQDSSPFIVGDRAFFGVMPDWNPAEIIGTNPGRLAVSIYRYLIMDDTWAVQRAEYGYRDVRPSPLLVSFCGRPYVDVRASFNSFIPAELDDEFAASIVEFCMQWLEQHPHLHDKIEFEVIPTCFSLDFEHWADRLVTEGHFSLNDVERLGQALLKITRRALDRNNSELASIAQLDQRYKSIQESKLSPLDRMTVLLDDAKQYGTLAFAHLARSAFVAVTLLRSAVSQGVISQVAMDEFMQSIRTVSHQYTEDAAGVAKNKTTWDTFLAKYGHLRPGTYDITSLSYADDPERFLRPVVKQSAELEHDEQGLDCWLKQRDDFASACAKAGLYGDIESIERFMRGAIEGREYAKFIFTRNVSAALDALVEYGTEYNLSREELSGISLDTLFAVKTGQEASTDIQSCLTAIAKDAELERNVTGLAELPPLITNLSDFRVFMYPSSQPNFVGSERITARCTDIRFYEDSENSLDGMIALIPQADPGYDWLFGQNIAGLITMYGGANSHMAIRAAEFGMPAAIGIGETEYQRLSGACVLELDAGNRRIQVVR